jgi:hypothetical protein
MPSGCPDKPVIHPKKRQTGTNTVSIGHLQKVSLGFSVIRLAVVRRNLLP